MEPPFQLERYFEDIDLVEALESFRQLAEFLERRDSPEQEEALLRATCSPSPSACSSCSLSASSFSPADSATSSPQPSVSGSDCWSGSSSPPFEGAFEAARGLPKEGRKRKARNAVAAERYRSKLKRRQRTLGEEMEREERRNERLRREIENKLTIYAEFVNLLSRNVHLNDIELASYGLRSLSSVQCIAAATCAAGHAHGLDQPRRKFELIASAGKLASGGQPATLKEEEELDEQLQYDFYLDSFIERQR